MRGFSEPLKKNPFQIKKIPLLFFFFLISFVSYLFKLLNLSRKKFRSSSVTGRPTAWYSFAGYISGIDTTGFFDGAGDIHLLTVSVLLKFLWACRSSDAMWWHSYCPLGHVQEALRIFSPCKWIWKTVLEKIINWKNWSNGFIHHSSWTYII